jgi:hypothetical protein
MSNTKFEIPIPQTQFVLKSDKMYQIQPKTDASAPDGFKDAGTTKVISPDIGNTVHAPFNGEMRVWDTGFTRASPILRGMKDAEKDSFLKLVNEHIVKPVEEIKGEGVLGHQENNDFLDNFGIELKAYRIINTAEPLQRLALYFAVLGKHLAPKEHQSNPLYSGAQYTIVNSEEAVNVRQEREMLKNEAIGLFYVLQKNDKEKMYDLLEYLNISNSKTTDKATLNSSFNRWLDDKTSGYQNSEIFTKTYDKFDSEDGEEELYMYKNLKKLHNKNLVKMQRGELFLDGKSIGAGYKLAASHLVANTEDKKKVADLIQQIQ